MKKSGWYEEEHKTYIHRHILSERKQTRNLQQTKSFGKEIQGGRRII